MMKVPAVILVQPQMPENIGMAARAMMNFGLSELRLVAPRDGWPESGAFKESAWQAASGAARILESATLFATTREAIADLNRVYATTARSRGQMKRIVGPEEAVGEMHIACRNDEKVGILFGRERTGLENDDIALADAIVTFPVDPALASLNLAQSVLLMGYEWARAQNKPVPLQELSSPPAPREAIVSFFEDFEQRLDAAGFYPEGKKAVMRRNMRDMFLRHGMSEQEIRTLRGAIKALHLCPEGERSEGSEG